MSSSNPIISKELIVQAQNGDMKAKNQLMKLILPDVKYCVRKSIDYHTREDLIQEACIRIINNLNKFKFQNQKFKNWVSVVTKSVVMNFFKEKEFIKNSVSSNMYFCDDFAIKVMFQTKGETFEFELEQDSKKITISDIIKISDNLPKCQREAFCLYYFEGMKYREIAEYLNSSLSTVKSNISRARKAFIKYY